MHIPPIFCRRRFHRSLALLGGTVLLLGLIFWGTPSRKVLGWGAHGHEISGNAAARKLPVSMPSFFRRASDQLAYLNPEPDRWRDRAESSIDRAMDAAAGPDHFIDLELVPAAARSAVHRYDFATELIKAGQKPTTTGLSPYRMLELFQRLRIQFRLWRQEKDSRKRGWIEARILNDAGILGHYVTDAANPHHTTIHYNGWSGPNPQGYTTYTRERGFHFRFEEEFVGAQVRMEDLLPRISSAPRTIALPRTPSSSRSINSISWSPSARRRSPGSTRSLPSTVSPLAPLSCATSGGPPGRRARPRQRQKRNGSPASVDHVVEWLENKKAAWGTNEKAPTAISFGCSRRPCVGSVA